MQVVFLHDQDQTLTAMKLMGNVNRAYPAAKCTAVPLNIPLSADVCAWLGVQQVPQIVVYNGKTVTAVLPMTETTDLNMAVKGSVE